MALMGRSSVHWREWAHIVSNFANLQETVYLKTYSAAPSCGKEGGKFHFAFRQWLRSLALLTAMRAAGHKFRKKGAVENSRDSLTCSN